ncbi:MAG: hypothetical protein JW844_08220 [Candidatus Omnitrophica bacterium]|nr:hypothetical protein [Candidatus Omnitrophota bacterium]
MKSKVVKKNGCRRVLEIEVSSGQRFDDARSGAYKELRKKVSVPGYRRGKAPLDAVVRHYQAELEEEMLKVLISSAYQDAIRELVLDPVSFPDITDVHFERPEKVSFKAAVDIRPEVRMKPIKQLKPKLPERPGEIEEKDVDEVLRQLQRQNARLVPAGDGQAPDAEKKEVLPEIDDAFAKDLGFDGLAKLKEGIAGSLKQRKEQQYKSLREEAVIDALLDMASFEVPESMVVRRLQELSRMFGGVQGDSQEKLDEKLREIAERQIRVSFILEKISQDEHIEIEKVMDFLMEKIAGHTSQVT